MGCGVSRPTKSGGTDGRAGGSDDEGSEGNKGGGGSGSETRRLDARSYRVIAGYHSSYSGEKPAQPDGWCAWTTVASGECPPSVGWLQKLFPNAQIDITDAQLANADLNATSEPPRALVDKFSRIPHGKSAEDVTHVGFANQIDSKWGDQYFLKVEIGHGRPTFVGGIVFQGEAVVSSSPPVAVALGRSVEGGGSEEMESFLLVMATDPSRALTKDRQHDINDEWNMYGASMKLTSDLDAAAIFRYHADNKHVSFEADRFLGLVINCEQVVEGGSCQLLRSKNQPEGGSGRPWAINADGTMSPAGESLVLGFGPITYDSWNRRAQCSDSIGGAHWKAIGLVSPTSVNRLIVQRCPVVMATVVAEAVPPNPTSGNH